MKWESVGVGTQKEKAVLQSGSGRGRTFSVSPQLSTRITEKHRSGVAINRPRSVCWTDWRTWSNAFTWEPQVWKIEKNSGWIRESHCLPVCTWDQLPFWHQSWLTQQGKKFSNERTDHSNNFCESYLNLQDPNLSYWWVKSLFGDFLCFL